MAWLSHVVVVEFQFSAVYAQCGLRKSSARAKIENIKGKLTRPSEEFLELSDKISYSAPVQFRYLQQILNLEPEVLE